MGFSVQAIIQVPLRSSKIDSSCVRTPAGVVIVDRLSNVCSFFHCSLVSTRQSSVEWSMSTPPKSRGCKGTGTFEKQIIREGGCGHGLGFGDVNGDGRGDFIIPNGWLEAPADPRTGEWAHRAEFDLGSASVPVLVHDSNGDGLADLIWGAAHGYGLFWLEQGRDAAGNRTWTRHEIDTQRSQYHDLVLADLDGDDELELITGKRYRAHSGNDPGADDPVGLYYFEIDGGRFRRVTLDFGPPAKASGAGIYLWVGDVNADTRPDIVAPGKEGLYVFLNGGVGLP